MSAVSGLKAGEKKFGKGTVYAADVFGILADYYQKKEKLEANYEQEGINSMVSWFYSSNTYTEDSLTEFYNTGIYNGYTIEAIKEWNREGISSFCVNVDIDKMGEKFFYEKDTIINIQTNGWWHINDLKEYSDEEIINAMLLILYGTEGMKEGSNVYISSFNNVADIDPLLFSTCILEINDEIASNQEDDSLQDLWNDKRRSYRK